MKKHVKFIPLLLILMIMLFVVSCNDTNRNANGNANINNSPISIFPNTNYRLLTIDSCEYIIYSADEMSSNRVFSITHKGDCNFCKLRK